MKSTLYINSINKSEIDLADSAVGSIDNLTVVDANTDSYTRFEGASEWTNDRPLRAFPSLVVDDDKGDELLRYEDEKGIAGVDQKRIDEDAKSAVAKPIPTLEEKPLNLAFPSASLDSIKAGTGTLLDVLQFIKERF